MPQELSHSSGSENGCNRDTGRGLGAVLGGVAGPVTGPLIHIAAQSDLRGLAAALAPDLKRLEIVNRFNEQRAGLRVLLVAKMYEEAVGTVSFSTHADPDGLTRRMFSLNVARGYRCNGVGTALVKAVEQIVLAVGGSAVRIEVAVSNRSARSLYEKLGYKFSGEPVKLAWSKGVDGHPSEIIVEEAYKMRKVLQSRFRYTYA